jgi:heme-degrading monooxygenase HmoA
MAKTIRTRLKQATTVRGSRMSLIARTPKPPYYAVIFTSNRTEGDSGYSKMAEKMVELASQQPGFLGIESAREEVGITVSYWSDLDSIQKWKNNIEHLEVQTMAKEKWYSSFKARIAKVERDYSYYQATPI